jgi:S-adenosylmethionine synthetase
MNTTFTSESVCAGHPDKICDAISDCIVDAALAEDPNSRVAIETLTTSNKIVIAGEVTTSAKINYENLARQQVKKLGYTKDILQFTYKSPIEVLIHQQSPEIAQGVDLDEAGNDTIGAGDQGMMFGYACDETTELMPLPIIMAHRLAEAIDRARETTLPYLRPDGKTQVTIEYKNDTPIAVRSLVLAVPHKEDIKSTQLRNDLYIHVVNPVLEHFGYSFKKSEVIINGTGVWHIGGPHSDTGVTGRKIVVDGYGGYARVGGGAFSGKDPTKVDRSGAYAARYLAKNIVAKGYAKKAEVRLAYFIGAKKPLMQEVETFGTATVSDKVISEYMYSLLDTSVSGIIEGLQLQRPIYTQTAAYGHFGRNIFPWEKIRE